MSDDVIVESEELASVKKPGDVEYVTKEEYEWRLAEIAKCKRDICYYARKYFKIVSLDKGLMTIDLYPKQEELLKAMVKNDRVAVLASRQTGKCVFKDTKVTVRNKKTGEVKEIAIGDFFELVK